MSIDELHAGASHHTEFSINRDQVVLSPNFQSLVLVLLVIASIMFFVVIWQVMRKEKEEEDLRKQH